MPAQLGVVLGFCSEPLYEAVVALQETSHAGMSGGSGGVSGMGAAVMQGNAMAAVGMQGVARGGVMPGMGAMIKAMIMITAVSDSNNCY